MPHSNNTVMNSHVTAAQNGQTTVVGHHRGFSQPTVTVAASNTGGDPWFLQSTGHQMPPTAPLRHNKRPAPQPTTVGGGGGGGITTATHPNNLLVNSSVGGGVGSNITLQQQFSQSQPHIVAQTAQLTTHHNNVVNKEQKFKISFQNNKIQRLFFKKRNLNFRNFL